MKKNKLISAICQTFADLVAGCDDYCYYYSLNEALRIAQNELGENIERWQVEGWLNPHLDTISENWEEWL